MRMKRFAWWLCLLPLAFFLLPQRLPCMFWTKKVYQVPPPIAFHCDPLTLLPAPKDELTDAFSDILTHPWIAKQTALKMVVPEMVRDVEAIATFCANYPQCDLEELTTNLIETLEPLQENLPLALPKSLYNVLWIAEKPTSCPFQFRVVKRLYLGESRLGFPIYLDVRQFDEADAKAVIDWHQAQVAADFISYGKGMVATGEGKMPGHGWDVSDRVVYLQWGENDQKLYVAYANLAGEDWESVKLCLKQ